MASKKGGLLRIPGSKGIRILSWAEAKEIADKFAALNPYNRKIVKGSILNLVDANYVDSDSKNPQRQLYGYSAPPQLEMRKRSSVKIAERTYEKRAQALHC